MSVANRSSSETFLLISALIFLVVTVLLFVGGTGFVIQKLFGPEIGPWKLTFREGLILVPVIFIALLVGLLFCIPLWTLFVRPFATRKEIRSALIYPGVFFFSWYGRKIADWLVPERNGDLTQRSSGRR